MKHRFINKKTGAEARVIAMYLDSDGVMQVDGYDTVEDLMDDYAAYERYNPPKEPLIKDEKIRKAVRAWAEANEIGDTRVFCGLHDNGFDTGDIYIDFNRAVYVVETGIKRGKSYTIDELCGEEEE